MLFWVHAAVAYLLYRVGVHRRRTSLDGTLVMVLVGAALLPDLIDKPVAFLVPSLPTRSIAHSLFAIIAVLLLVANFVHRFSSPRVGIAFAAGYLSHIGADLVDILFVPDESLAFLLWPVLTDYHHIETIADLLSLVEPSPYVLGQSVIVVVALALWIHDGKPGFPQISRRAGPVR